MISKNTFIFFLLAIALILGCNGRKTNNHDGHAGYYTCSMHPDVKAGSPGSCPICGMALIPVHDEETERSDELILTDQQIQLGNIRCDTIKYGNIPNELELSGILSANQNNVRTISARSMGRIVKLYYKYEGEYIIRSKPVYSIYSEELNNAKQEYLLAFQRKQQSSEIKLPGIDEVLRSATHKLMLWGMTTDQIRELGISGKADIDTDIYTNSDGYILSLDVAEGDYVMEGGTIMQLTDLSTLWVEIQGFSNSNLDLSEPYQVTVTIPGMNELKINSKIEYSNPEINTGSRLRILRATIPNKGNRLRPGMSAHVTVTRRSTSKLTVPVDAVIHNGQNAYVWIRIAPLKFRMVMVQKGLESNSAIEILSGLKNGDQVVVTGAYLLNSEYTFKKGADPMQGHNMNEM